jgi:hypothetical protein
MFRSGWYFTNNKSGRKHRGMEERRDGGRERGWLQQPRFCLLNDSELDMSALHVAVEVLSARTNSIAHAENAMGFTSWCEFAHRHSIRQQTSAATTAAFVLDPSNIMS